MPSTKHRLTPQCFRPINDRLFSPRKKRLANSLHARLPRSFFFSSSFFCFRKFVRRLLLHLDRIAFLHAQPFRFTSNRGGIVIQHSAPTILKAHPGSIALINNSMIATPPAAMRQRVILTEAEAVAGDFGLTSTIKVLRTVNMPVTVNPTTKFNTSGAARCVPASSVQP
jgi:hypothetical protein